MFRKKAQAALEFLSTYGFAFLIILVMIGALAYFGVLNPQRFLPDRCLLETGFDCEDFQIIANTDDREFNIFIGNNIGKAVTIDSFTADFAGLGTGVTCHGGSDASSPEIGTSGGAVPVTINAGTSSEVFCTASPATGLVFPPVGEKLKIQVEFTYTEAGGRFPKTAAGEIFAEVQ